jgi:hypothetical protein
MGIDQGIVHELAESGDRSVLGSSVGGTQGVADAEAHAVMFGELDGHGRSSLGFRDGCSTAYFVTQSYRTK